MKAVNMTKENYLKAGQEILADPRCDAAAKADVRASTTGEEQDGLFLVYLEGHAWWHEIIERVSTPAELHECCR